MKLEDFKVKAMFPGQPVGDPQVSPDGGSILFTHTVTDLKEDKRYTHIWINDENGTRQYTNCKGNDNAPRWSPDGGKILFLSNRMGDEDKEDPKKKPKSQAWLMSASGGEAKRLTKVEAGVQNPSWSPDGRHVHFYSPVFKGEWDKDGAVKVIRRIKYRFDRRGYFPGRWSHIFTVSADGGDVKQLTDGEYDVGASAWSPDCATIAFVANMDEWADISFYRKIYTIPAAGGEPELLWDSEKEKIGGPGSLSWSPDGKFIAFTARPVDDLSNVGYRNSEVWIIPSEGGKAKCLTASLDRTASAYGRMLLWSPDSKYLYFKTPDKGTMSLRRVNLEGVVETVLDGKRQIGGYSMSRDVEVIAFTYTDFSNPHEIYKYSNGAETKITELSKDLLGELGLSEPEEFWLKNSDDVDLQCWIMKPHNYTPEEKYPTVLVIHGGPAGAYGYSLTSPNFNVLADHGYTVAFMNPTGSVVFGEKFAAGVAGHWGERDYHDMMDTLDFLSGIEYVDSDRLGVMGGSYGGYMTNWLVGHTDKFKAAVALDSMSNLYSGTGTSDIDYMDHSVTAGKNPWEDVDYFMARSPISYVENVVTPLLLMHSSSDYRCPMDNAEQMFTALKKLKKTVEFVIFPGSHGYSRANKPSQRIQSLQHILRWFDRYL